MTIKRVKEILVILCLLAILCLVTGMNPFPGKGNNTESAEEAFGSEELGIEDLTIEWSSGGPYGGHVNCLAINPIDPDVLYAGTEGGVYKSVDAGSNWTRTSFPAMPVREIRVAEDQPDVVYAGTDEGVYKSTNGGASWSQRGMAGQKIFALAIHPEDSDVVYAGNTTWPYLPEEDEIVGVFKSTDGGQTWDPIHTDDINGVETLLIDTNDPSVIYAGVRDAGSGATGFRKSIDDGENWDGYGPSDPVFALAMTPQGHSPSTIYASCRSGNYLYKSTDQGETWEPIDPPGFYKASGIAVDPNSPSTIYVSANEYASYEGGGIFYQSYDGGDTWALKTSGLTGSLTSSVIIDPRNSHVYVGCQKGGVFKSLNEANDWSHANEGFNNTYINGLAVQSQSSNKAFAAIQGHVLSKTTDAGETWSYLDQSHRHLGAIAVDPNNPMVLWVGEDFVTGSSFDVHKSTDGGLSWTPLEYLQTLTGTTTTGVSDIVVNRINSNCILVGTTYEITDVITGKGVLARSLNGGLS